MKFIVTVYPEDPQPFHLSWQNEDGDVGTLGKQSTWEGALKLVLPLVDSYGDTFHIRSRGFYVQP